MNYIKQLHHAFERLSKAKDLDDLLRRSVTSLIANLNFDRAGILWYNPNSHQQIGTWGTDIKGNVIDEHNLRVPVSEDLLLKPHIKRYKLDQHHDFYGLLDQPDPKAWVFQHTIFSGEELFGWIFVDNYIKRKDIEDTQIEAIKAFATALSQWVVMKKMEDSLLNALDALAAHETKTFKALKKAKKLETKIADNKDFVELSEQFTNIIPISARALGNLVNFISLLDCDHFNVPEGSLKMSAEKCAYDLNRMVKFADDKIYKLTLKDFKEIPLISLQEYLKIYLGDLYQDQLDIKISCQAPTEIASLSIILLTKIINELVKNSIHHGFEQSDKKLIAITISTDNGNIVIQVEDSGCGLNNHERLEVLQLFYSSKPHEHLGIGLNVVQQYLELWLNGHLQLSYSDHLGGLCCLITFPIVRNRFN